MGIATGATIFGDDSNLIKIEDITANDLGEVDEVTITKDDTLLLRGRGDQTEIEKRIEHITDEIEQSTSDYEKEKLNERLAKLSKGVAVLKIGGGSEVEVGEKKVCGIWLKLEKNWRKTGYFPWENDQNPFIFELFLAENWFKKTSISTRFLSRNLILKPFLCRLCHWKLVKTQFFIFICNKTQDSLCAPFE